MTQNNLVVKMIFDRWNALVSNCNTLLNGLTDAQLQQEIVAGKNRGIYILGHLIAVHDDMRPLLNLGERQYPELFEIFVKSPDKSVEFLPSVQDLRETWQAQIKTLQQNLESIPAEEWFDKHNAVSAEDFIKEPHRNKLNILLTRTTHLAYHAGQLKLIH